MSRRTNSAVRGKSMIRFHGTTTDGARQSHFTQMMCATLFAVGTVGAGSSAMADASNTWANPATSVAAVPSDIEPAKLIESMSLAISTLNYEGVFVHAQGGNLTSMHILHANYQRGEFERMYALDGEAREVIRNNSLVTCIWPDSQSVVVSESKPRDLLPKIDANLVNNQRYTFSQGQPDRVAGRYTYVVNVMPRDDFRYGYRFWIDTETSMLLRSMLLESSDRPVEQIFFTHIEFPDTIDIMRFEVLEQREQENVETWLEPKQKQARSSLVPQDNTPTDRVGFSSLPDGYMKISETSSSMSINEMPVTHVMLTDGMASVSVYVENANIADHSDAPLGLSRMGAMNAYGISIGDALITAVGEVPEVTVKVIAAAVILKE